ncbi:toll/interleukin-1 receptor domain-containing protein [Candidatus Accumulibacter sp. ACC005]|uniref:toll/interleukin-1 receptor domain-containing protein n=1 Tax=Candidatus Accumulibacter sp. ACC005 TaxID=2823331 RepID=UPI0025C0B5EA|nr:toll/interleukin-1 receptor domain-containing protein [Candidatus Accumulibacter sp. ACC005]
MAIRIDALRSAATRQATVVARSLDEARTLDVKTAFLCHSHQDADLAKGLVHLLSDAGWRVYIDWQDAEMPNTPNRETAQRIKQKIIDLDFFLFLATQNSMASRWCPWEIGYADGKKQLDRILIVPTEDGAQTHGNEYLQLYRQITLSDKNELAVWQPGQNTDGVLVKNL